MTVHQTTDAEVAIAEYDAVGEATATGRPYQFRYVQNVRAREGKIVPWSDYWNPLAGFSILGRLPDRKQPGLTPPPGRRVTRHKESGQLAFY